MKLKTSCIYVLENNLGHYKIGLTKNLERRLAQFRTALPFKFSTLTKIQVDPDKAQYYETWLHRYFADKRINGEWFILDYWSLKLLVEYMDTEADLINLIWYTDKSGECETCPEMGLTKQLDYMIYRDSNKFDVCFAEPPEIRTQINYMANKLWN